MIRGDVADPILELIDEGRYYDALRVPASASRMDIEVASAQLEQERPEIAGIISGITQVITREEKKVVYMAAVEFRDGVLYDLEARHGPDFLLATPGCAKDAWSRIQVILRCDFKKGDVKITVPVAQGLAKEKREWIVEEVVNDLLPLVIFTKEVSSGRESLFHAAIPAHS